MARRLYTVLGSGGFIGSHLVRYLRDAGHEVYAPEKGDAAVLRRPMGELIYAIGLTADFRERPYATAEAHVGYLNRVLQEASFDSVTYLSSTRVYRRAGTGQEGALLGVFPDADSLYDLSKLTGEALTLQTGRGRVARLSNVIGAGASESFVAQLAAAARAGHVQLQSSPDSAKDYIMVRDVVAGLAALPQAEPGIYNIASGRNTTTAEILEALAACWQFAVTVEEGAASFRFPVLDTSRISRLIDWKPQSVVQWLQTNNVQEGQGDKHDSN